MSFKNTLRKLAYGLTLAGLVATQPTCNYNYASNPITANQVSAQVTQESRKTNLGSLEQLARQGLPQEFREMGFTLGDYVNRGTDREVIILAEIHHFGEAFRSKQGKLIRYFIDKLGAESLGTEGCYGEYPNLHTLLVSQEYFDNFVDYWHNSGVNIPIYGIEDKELYDSYDSKNLSHYDDLEFDIKFNICDRNKGFAKNIQKHMEKNKSKLDVIITGVSHTHTPFKEIRNFQDILPYSYLIIYSPKCKGKEDSEEYFKSEAKKRKIDYPTYQKYQEEVTRFLRDK